MSEPSDGGQAGRGHPPREHRWRKGKSGNPDGVRRSRPESTLTMIDRLLLRPVNLVLNGRQHKATVVEAIIHQLLQKAVAGNVRASKVLQSYWLFATQTLDKKLELTFIDSDYTRALREMGRK